jgi:hypothetical protein
LIALAQTLTRFLQENATLRLICTPDGYIIVRVSAFAIGEFVVWR